jgi:adenylosuccinate lyase
MSNPNILSDRYATPEINQIFSKRGRILAEREFWIAVMNAQKQLGLDIPHQEINKYILSKENINLERINEIEKITRHDIKAKIQAFVEVAQAQEHIHKGLTARDLTDNVEQLQIKKASNIILTKSISVLNNLIKKSNEYKDIILTARTHHQPAQPTLLGRRFSMWAEELLTAITDLEIFINNYPLRGIKGAVGTQSDQLTLLQTKENVEKLENSISQKLGFSNILSSPGQVYPRSLDYSLISKLTSITSACENFAKTMRLMSGYELTTEGFKQGQVGSTAMPHKMNTRSSERICGFAELLKMYSNGASKLSGDQWEEGDVSCSVIRRVIIPDTFYTIDGLLETVLTVLNEMGPYPQVINKEVDRYLPFLATTTILMHAVQAGIGREQAHEIIKKYAVQEALAMRTQGEHPQLAKKLASDPLFQSRGITEEKINEILQNRERFIGNAQEQIQKVNEKAQPLFSRHPEALNYNPKDIL